MSKYKYYFVGSYDGTIAIDEFGPDKVEEAIMLILTIYNDREGDDYEPFDADQFRLDWSELTTDMYSDIMLQLTDGHRITIIKKEIDIIRVFENSDMEMYHYIVSLAVNGVFKDHDDEACEDWDWYPVIEDYDIRPDYVCIKCGGKRT